MKQITLLSKRILCFSILISISLILSISSFAEDIIKPKNVELNYLNDSKSLTPSLKPLMNIKESEVYSNGYLKKGPEQLDKHGVKWIIEGDSVFTCDYRKQSKEVYAKIKDYKTRMAKAEKLYNESVKSGKPIEIKSGNKYKEGWHPKKIAMMECGVRPHGSISEFPRMEQIKIDVKKIMPHTYHLFFNLGGKSPDIQINAGTGGHRNIFINYSSRGLNMKVDNHADKLLKKVTGLPITLGKSKDTVVQESVWYEVMIELNGDNIVTQFKNLQTSKTTVFLGAHPILKSGRTTNLVVYTRRSTRVSLKGISIFKCKPEMKDSWKNLTQQYAEKELK